MELHSQTILRSLIEERAPWFFSRSPGLAMARSILRPLLSYDQTLATLERLRPLDGEEIFSVMGRQLAQHVHTHNLRKFPASGPCLIVCNHPTGIADGIILHKALAQVRPDMYFFANRDVLRVFPQLDSKIAPIEWRPEKRSHQSMREVMEFVRKAVAAERVGIIFPSGRLAKRRGFKLHERPWMASAAMAAAASDGYGGDVRDLVHGRQHPMVGEAVERLAAKEEREALGPTASSSSRPRADPAGSASTRAPSPPLTRRAWRGPSRS